MNHYQEDILFRTQDEYSEISVTEHALIRNLYFGSDKKQSSMFVPDPSMLILPYSQAMSLSLLYHPEPTRILLIGLGGGSLVHFLLKACPDCEIDVVELRDQVISVCHEFFLLPRRIHALNIHHADAKDFIAATEREKGKKYDIVFLDAFDQHGPADINNDMHFLESCRQILSRNGILCSNLWNRREDDFHQWYRKFSKLFKDNCMELRLGKINSNVVAFGFASSKYESNFKVLKRRAEDFKNQFGMDFPKYLKLLDEQNNSLLKKLKRIVVMQT